MVRWSGSATPTLFMYLAFFKSATYLSLDWDKNSAAEFEGGEEIVAFVSMLTVK